MIITKKVNISCINRNSYEKIMRKCEKLGVEILSNSFNARFDCYDVKTRMNIDQCYSMLDYLNNHIYDGLLWKGE